MSAVCKYLTMGLKDLMRRKGDERNGPCARPYARTAMIPANYCACSGYTVRSEAVHRWGLFSGVSGYTVARICLGACLISGHRPRRRACKTWQTDTCRQDQPGRYQTSSQVLQVVSRPSITISTWTLHIRLHYGVTTLAPSLTARSDSARRRSVHITRGGRGVARRWRDTDCVERVGHSTIDQHICFVLAVLDVWRKHGEFICWSTKLPCRVECRD